jgi:flagellar assembly protein FliH
MSETVRRKIPAGSKVTPFWLPDLRDSDNTSVASSRPVSENDKRRAREIGYQDGRQMAEMELEREKETLRAAHENLTKDLVSAISALESARSGLEKQDALSVKEAERKAVELAYELCETILEREVNREGAVLEALERGVALLASREPSIIRCHESDVNTLKDQLPTGSVRIVPDESVSKGGCIIESGAARVDARWESALLRVRESLGISKAP